MTKFLRFSILIIIGIFIFNELVYAIPSFARKYRLSCQTCHSPIPRLKDFGEEFAGNGFKLEDHDASRYFVETGDKELLLIRDFPISLRIDGYLNYNKSNSDKGDLAAPYLVKLASGGQIAENISYYLYFFFTERGIVEGIEDAFVMFNNVLGTELDVYVGQFQVSDPLFKRELRLTYEDYNIYKVKPGISHSSLTYDRGIMLEYGFDWGLELAASVVNGNGIGGMDSYKTFDIDGYKNYFGRVSQDITDFLRIGGFAYWGKEKLMNDAGNNATNELLVWGPDITLSYDDLLELNLQYVHRTDKNLFLSKDATDPTIDLETKGAFAELVFTPQGDKSTWYAAAIFNWIESQDKRHNYKAATAHLGYLISRNFRLVTEFNYNFSKSDVKYNQFGIGMVTAF